MAQELADRRDIDFVLWEQFKGDERIRPFMTVRSKQPIFSSIRFFVKPLENLTQFKEHVMQPLKFQTMALVRYRVNRGMSVQRCRVN